MRAKFVYESIKHLTPQSEENIRQHMHSSIAASILNNGFFTVAHNWDSDTRKYWESLFKELGVDKNFMNYLDLLFIEKSCYEDPTPEGAYREDPEDFREGAWEEMCTYAGQLDKYLDKHPELIKKLQEISKRSVDESIKHLKPRSEEEINAYKKSDEYTDFWYDEVYKYLNLSAK